MLKVIVDIVADVEANKKLSSIVTKILMKHRKLNISLAFISQCYFKVPKNIRLND